MLPRLLLCGRNFVSTCLIRLDVRFWPKADICFCAAHVRFQRYSGHDRLRKSAFAVAIGGKADMPFCTAHVCF
jgi:hypothetical protein